MNELKFKTNIKCGGCIAAVTPYLNKTAGENNWKVNIENADKILTVNAGSSSEEEILKAVKAAGYQAEKI